jgi:hypothetical protein
MPLSQLLFRYVWPFWLFKDATRGDRYARAAAYRHNRDMRIYLPGYLMRWMLVSALTLGVVGAFSSLSTTHASTMFALLAAGSGVVFACCVCVLFVTSCIYLYLSRHDA